MKKPLVLFAVLFLLLGCEKEVPLPVLNMGNPTEALLIFPYENSECHEGTNITATESTVMFEWSQAANSDSYDLVLKNLSTNDETTYMTSENELPIVILRATPYAWYIISKSNAVNSTAQSETWKFYNAGDGITSYAPFPAEIISPAMAEIISTAPTEITLDWDGSDVDDDIMGYDVYFGTTNPPDLLAGNVQESSLTEVPVSPDTIYYWSVTTIDEHGNSSESGIYQFKIL